MSDLQTLVAQEVKRQVASLLTADATVKKVLNYLKSSGGGGLPLGHLFAWPFQTPPDGAIQCNGAEYNRALYADFFAHASSKGWVKTEAEWQQIASANGGFCPWYSDGDGSTTFRTPKFAPFMQVAIASGSVGSYHQDGLPGLQGTAQWPYGGYATQGKFSGALYLSANNSMPGTTGGADISNGRPGIGLDASRYNAIYGRSETVQPESHEWMICVVVAGQATNIGSVDVANVMGAVAQVQADVSTKVDSSSPHIVDEWSDGNGNWWRKYSDGFIEQAGRKAASTVTSGTTYELTLHTSFSTTNYFATVVANKESGGTSEGMILVKSLTTSKFSFQTQWYANYSQESLGFFWYACGY